MIVFTESMLIPALTPSRPNSVRPPRGRADARSRSGRRSGVYADLRQARRYVWKKEAADRLLSFYTFGMIANGFAWDLQSLLVFRALQGLGMNSSEAEHIRSVSALPFLLFGWRTSTSQCWSPLKATTN